MMKLLSPQLETVACDVTGKKRGRDAAEAEPEPAAYDLGPDAFRAFGFEFVVGTGVEASVKYAHKDSPDVVKVVLEITDPVAIDESLRSTAGDLYMVWSRHASACTDGNRAVFRGACASALATLAHAAFEASSPGVAGVVLDAYFPSATRNTFQSPYSGLLEADKDKENWKRRNADVRALQTAINTRVAMACTEELADMYARRRLQKPVLERGTKWAHSLPSLEAACARGADGAFDLDRGVFALYVYTVYVDAWSATLKGPKTAVAHAVKALRDKVVAALRAEFVLQEW